MAVLDEDAGISDPLSVGERVFHYVELYRRANKLSVREVNALIGQAGASYAHSWTRAQQRSVNVHTLQVICTVLDVAPYDIVPALHPLKVEDLEISEVQVRYNLTLWANLHGYTLPPSTLPNLSFRQISVSDLCRVAYIHQIEMPVLTRRVPDTVLNRFINHKETL